MKKSVEYQQKNLDTGPMVRENSNILNPQKGKCLPWVVSPSDKIPILDLDETCIHTYTDMNLYRKISQDPQFNKIRNRIYYLNIPDIGGKGSGIHGQVWGIERPYLKDFLTYLVYNFKTIIVWSAGIEPYVHAIVNHIFKGIGRPNIIYSRKQCLNVGTERDKRYTKPISSLIDSNWNLRNRKINMKNTFIIDDRIDYVQKNFSNAIVIPPYSPSTTVESMSIMDKALLRIMTWMNNDDFRQSKDIRYLPKDGIFTLPSDQLICTFDMTISDPSNLSEREKKFINLLFDPAIVVQA